MSTLIHRASTDSTIVVASHHQQLPRAPRPRGEEAPRRVQRSQRHQTVLGRRRAAWLVMIKGSQKRFTPARRDLRRPLPDAQRCARPNPAAALQLEKALACSIALHSIKTSKRRVTAHTCSTMLLAPLAPLAQLLRRVRAAR